MPVKPIPEGYHAVTPYLVARGADKTVEFLKKAFGAEMSFEPMLRPDGKIMHADLKIGDSHVMISEASEQHPAMPCMVHLYVPDADAVYRRAVAAGGTTVMEPSDQFYGDRRRPAGTAQARRSDVQAAERQGCVGSALGERA
jgi:PhnB protein